MVQKIFKHIDLPIWARQCGTNSEMFGIEWDDRELETSLDRLEGEQLSRRYLEKSPDWQEITQKELVEGRWYKGTAEDTSAIFRIVKIKGDDIAICDLYGIKEGFVEEMTMKRDWIEREATPEEIHQALDAIRIEKGLVEGVKIKEVETGEVKVLANNNCLYHKGQNYCIDTFSGEYIAVGGCYATCKLYSKGQWAEKVEQPELVEGRWYKDEYYMGRWDGEIRGINAVILNDAIRIFDKKTVIDNAIASSKKNLIECTPEEIHQALDAICEFKGFVEGVKVKSLLNGRIRIIKNKTEYDIKDDILYIICEVPEMSYEGRISIYKQGQWAEKVEEPIITTQDGYEITDLNEDLWFVDFDDFEVYPIEADEETVKSQDYVFYYYRNAVQYLKEYEAKHNKAKLKYLEKQAEDLLTEIRNLRKRK